MGYYGSSSDDGSGDYLNYSTTPSKSGGSGSDYSWVGDLLKAVAPAAANAYAVSQAGKGHYQQQPEDPAHKAAREKQQAFVDNSPTRNMYSSLLSSMLAKGGPTNVDLGTAHSDMMAPGHSFYTGPQFDLSKIIGGSSAAAAPAPASGSGLGTAGGGGGTGAGPNGLGHGAFNKDLGESQGGAGSDFFRSAYDNVTADRGNRTDAFGLEKEGFNTNTSGKPADASGLLAGMSRADATRFLELAKTYGPDIARGIIGIMTANPGMTISAAADAWNKAHPKGTP